MNIEAGVDLNRFFDTPVQYQVPLFQRRYIWNKVNWERLWRDILAQLGLELIEDSEGKFSCQESEQPEIIPNLTPDKEGARKHFTGIIVTRPIHEKNLKSFEVIDGQQRLTTFQIILCVIRDIFQSNGHDAQMQGANALIVNRDDTISRYSEEARYKFVPIEYDKDEFEVVVKGKYDERIPNAFDETSGHIDSDKLSEIISEVSLKPEDLSKNVLKAYNYFYKWIKGYMEKDFDFKKLDDLLDTIKNQFTFAIIDLDQLDRRDKSEEIFESLNATGQMLSQFDYLRNNLFLRASNLGLDEGSRKLYTDIFYTNYWHYFDKKENRSYWTTETLDKFFSVFLKAKLGPNCFEPKNIKSSELYRRYSKGLDKTHSSAKNKIEHEFKQLNLWAKSFRELQSSQVFENYKNFCDDLSFRYLDSFLLFVEHTNSAQLSDATKILESYIIRSLLVLERDGHTHADIKESCFKTIESCFSKAVGTPFCKNSFIECLLHSNREIDISNNAVRHAFWEISVYKNRNAEFVKYVLNKIISEDQMMDLRNLSWEDLESLITDITNYLSSQGIEEQLIQDFNEVWPELY